MMTSLTRRGHEASPKESLSTAQMEGCVPQVEQVKAIVGATMESLIDGLVN